ncbi:hypothetical protein VTH82DRAFT_7932 [Thermothelomyces myriococcoides]
MSTSPYDPYIPNNSSGEGGSAGNSRFEEANKEIQAAKLELQKNAERLMDRRERIEDLHEQSNKLADSAQTFRRSANRVRKQMWWKDMKMRIWLAIGIIVLLAIIIVPAVVTSTKK